MARDLVKRNMSKGFQTKEQRHWAIEKPKLDKLGKREIYNIDPDDMEFRNTKQNAGKKLEVPLESALPCKSQCHSTQGDWHRQKTQHAEITICMYR